MLQVPLLRQEGEEDQRKILVRVRKKKKPELRNEIGAGRKKRNSIRGRVRKKKIL